MQLYDNVMPLSMPSYLADCLMLLELENTVELDKRRSELGALIAQCRTFGWVQPCRDADGSVSIGRRFGAVFQLSPAGREALAAYRLLLWVEAVKRAKRRADLAEEPPAPYAEYAREQPANITPGEYRRVFS